MELKAVSPARADRVDPAKIAVRRRSSQIHGIDLLRFLAASLVAFYHLGFAIWASPHRPALGLGFTGLRPAAPVLGTGWVGVEIFFVISGFVIAYTANGRAPLAFARSRFLRLWPAVLVCATIAVPALLAIGTPLHNVAIDYVHSITFFPHDPWVATAYWSLPVEIVFYGLVFLLIASDRFRHVETAACVLGGASASVWIGHALLPADSAAGQWIAGLAGSRLGAMALIHHGLYFAGGILAWLVATRGLTVRRAVFLAVFAVAAFAEIANQAAATQGFMQVPVSGLLASALFVAGMAAILISVVANEAIGTALAPLLPAVRLLGLASYPLYLLHEPVGEAVIAGLEHAGVGDRLAMLGGYGTALALAIVVARHIEPGLRGWMQARLAPAGRCVPARWSWARRTSSPL